MTFTTDLAETLYHTCAETLPLIDYHNHIPARDIAENRTAADAEALWVRCDPYKHRLMRICGIPEERITGAASEGTLFETWCSVLPRTVGTPVYDWSVMELQTYFGITEPVSGETAASVRARMDSALRGGGFGTAELLRASGTVYSAPCAALTEDPAVFRSAAPFRFVPSLRLDPLLAPDDALTDALGCTGGCLRDYEAAVLARLDAFEAVGCGIIDISLDDGWRYTSRQMSEDRALSACDPTELSSAVLRFLGRQCTERGWKLLLHIGALRETSPFLRHAAGKTGGFAAIGGPMDIRALTAYFRDTEDAAGTVPSTLLFNFNPADNAAAAVLTGSFAGGRIGVGSPWWWNDHRRGMQIFFDTLSAYSVLSAFFGMTTDSRSVLSAVRHAYFRQVLCGWIGERVRAGELPKDLPLLRDTVYRMCYGNAAEFFRIGE